MNTETRIKEISEELCDLIKKDNDAPRFIEEYLSNLGANQTDVCNFRYEIEQLEKDYEELKSEKEDAEDRIEELGERIEQLKNARYPENSRSN